MVGPLLTAIRTLLFFLECGTSIMTTNQRPDNRSNRTRGSEGLLTPWELKKFAVVVFNAPGAPVLAKTLMRPLTQISIWLGPTAPMLSGGIYPASDNCAPRKLVPTLCAVINGDSAVGPENPGAGDCAACGDAGLPERFLRFGNNLPSSLWPG